MARRYVHTLWSRGSLVSLYGRSHWPFLVPACVTANNNKAVARQRGTVAPDFLIQVTCRSGSWRSSVPTDTCTLAVLQGIWKQGDSKELSRWHQRSSRCLERTAEPEAVASGWGRQVHSLKVDGSFSEAMQLGKGALEKWMDNVLHSLHQTSPVSYPVCSHWYFTINPSSYRTGIRESFNIRKSVLPREQCGCQKPVEWEVTITVRRTVITDLSLLSLSIPFFRKHTFPGSAFDHTGTTTGRS